jgi:hypothetical protein
MNSTSSKTLLFLILASSLLSAHTFAQFDTQATPIESISVKEGFQVELTLHRTEGQDGVLGQPLPGQSKPHHCQRPVWRALPLQGTGTRPGPARR